MREVIETVNFGTVDGFEIIINALPEHMSLQDSFDVDNFDIDKMYDDLESYDAIWFCAEVLAFKNDIELGCAYLGGCYYDSFNQFIQIEKNGYLEDMIKESIGEAKQAIKELTK